ncbi:hypothetical protein BD770DRAFT_399845 [Pilaira anomala]|nr:hypothetical protein BD770DRAFT_399845 [Pilaira anomala]
MQSEEISDLANECAGRGNQYASCLPESDAVWVNGTSHAFIWNRNNPYYVGYEKISLYLYYIVKFEYVSVKNFTDLDRTYGGIQVIVDDSWFLESLPDNSLPQNLSISAFYLPSTLSPYAEISSPISMFPRPYNFTVTQFALTTDISTLSSPDSTSSNTDTNNNSNEKISTASENTNNNSQHHGLDSSILPGWAIAVIVIAVIAFICAVIALIWAIIISRRNKRTNKLDPISRSGGVTTTTTTTTGSGGGGGGYHKEYSGSINSQTKVTAFRSTDSVPMTTGSTGENASSIGTLAYDNNNNKFASSEGVFMADSFRSTLGRSTSDWNTVIDEPEVEELKRRKLGEALLQRQLEEDGTSVKHAGRFTRVKSLADIPKSAVFEHPKY